MKKFEVEIIWKRAWVLEVEAENGGEAEKLAIEQVKVLKIPPATDYVDAVAIRIDREGN